MDMLHMFEKVVDRRFPNCELLFLGDYVDRGFNSVEVFTFLVSLKLAYPKKIHMLRGNHESRGMTEHFSFRNEVLDKLGSVDIYDHFMECFDNLPIAAVVLGEKSGNYLCMHGGISPNMRSKADIDKIMRKEEPPMSGLFCDLLWSDPLEDKYARKKTFIENSERQCSYYYGIEPVKRILSEGNYNSLLRAH
jgi:serine/threonine-protein phosphatase 2B catalytic subunit